ncbi:MAG: hypothetical protein HY305_06995 [Sphingobacteriales bacterium]|nr:hypothetical protein [Sphingobacteriales bacterium]
MNSLTLKILTTILLFILSCTAFSQTISLETSDAASGHSSVHFAYLLFSNRIKTTIENKNCDSFFLTTNNGTIEKDTAKRCEYIFYPEKDSANPAIIFYNKIINKDTIQFHKQEIWIHPFPFVATVSDIPKNGNCAVYMKKERFLNSSLRVEALNTGLDAFLPITDFKLTVFRDSIKILDREFREFNKTSFKFIEKELKEILPEDSILYSNIKYAYTSEYHYETDPIWIKIK